MITLTGFHCTKRPKNLLSSFLDLPVNIRRLINAEDELTSSSAASPPSSSSAGARSSSTPSSTSSGRNHFHKNFDSKFKHEIQGDFLLGTYKKSPCRECLYGGYQFILAESLNVYIFGCLGRSYKIG